MKTMTPADPLCARLADDLHRAFPELVEAFAPGLYSGALRMLGHRQDAEDVTQDALIRAFRALETYPAQRIRDLRVQAWLWTITANLCRNRLRQRSRRPASTLDSEHSTVPVEPSPGPADEALMSETARDLADMLLALPWAMRSAVVLRHVVGLTTDEIAEALDRPAGTVRSDISRGLARLRDLHQEDLP
jgi:RNA polymerase sigma factor (sigma-70 family)